jgi:hypothetical protein
MKRSFAKKEYELDLYGEAFKLRYPNVDDAEKLNLSIKEKGDDGEVEAICSFLDGLGLPKEKAKAMEIEHLMLLVEDLVPNKKK